MDVEQRLELARLRGAERANGDDAKVWRWYADLMEERRLACRWKNERWEVDLDGCALAHDSSFDRALRTAKSLCAST